MKKLFALLLLTSCAEPGVTYQHDATAQCPSAFWVPDNVAAEFRKYPEGSPMREFFKNYVNQQRALDAYYTPTAPINKPQ